jgi:hypothetical protein
VLLHRELDTPRNVVGADDFRGDGLMQLRRNTDRQERHRHAALRLATAGLIIGRLIDYRNRWNPTPT